MKTVDLIPLILLELSESDKYGFELTKAIETKSGGKIIIKQPTLYTLLKKLEKSKFISSYWEDSEIGGKRHYYKLTQNGKLQVSTLPSYSDLLKKVLEEDLVDNSELVNVDFDTKISAVEQPNQTERRVSIMDELLNSNITSAPTETILPTEEVFADNNFDASTEFELNATNADILKDEKTSQEEQFATNPGVMKFTEKVTYGANSHIDTTPINQISFDVNFNVPKTEIDVEYVDYSDFKNSPEYKTSKKIVKNMLYQSLATSTSLILMVILCSFITSFTGRSVLYYSFFISAILIAIFYPIVLLINLDKMRLKYQETQFTNKTRLRFLIGFAIVLSTFLLCVIVNIVMGNNTINLMLHIKNFSNVYAPLLISAVYFLDLLYYRIFLSKLFK